MTLLARSLFLATTLFFPAITLASAIPESFSNTYVSSALGFNVTVVHELKPRDDGTKEMRFEAKAWFGNIEETSVLRIDDEGQVIPLHYSYKRRGLGRNRDAALTFDWEKHLVTNDVQNTSWKMDIIEDVQDKLSYQLQLQRDVAQGKTTFVYQIADGGHLKEYAFEVVGEEVLKTPMGDVNTIKVKRSRDNNERTTFVWLAPDWDYLLVSMEQEEKGKTYNINLRKAVVDGEHITSFAKPL
jgi:hypothetical protein